MTGNKKIESEETAAAGPLYTSKAGSFILQHGILISLALIACLGLLAYSNTFGVPFLLDDSKSIVDNEAIKSLHGLISDWRYPRIVGSASFAVNYWIGGLNVMGYHLFNLVIHIINGMLVFGLVRLLFQTPFFRERRPGKSVPDSTVMLIALFAGLLFVAHPIQTQAVTYAVQRFASLATMFYLLSLSLFIKWRLVSGAAEAAYTGRKTPNGITDERALLFSASLGTALLAMCTKEIAFTLPLMLLLLEFFFFSGNKRRRIVRLLPFFLTMLVIPLRMLVASSPLTSAEGVTPAPPRLDYLLTQFRVIVTYLRLVVFPVAQNLDYDYPIYHSIINPNVCLSLILILATIAASVFLFRYSRKQEGMLLRLVAFGVIWFFVTLSVESSVIPIGDIIFEHRLYLPSVGLIIAATAAIVSLVSSCERRFHSLKTVMIAGLALLVAGFAAATFSRNGAWHDSVSIWADTAQKSPGKARPHNNLGVGYEDRKMHDKALNEFERAISIDPEYADAHNNLGTEYQISGMHDKALNEFERAISIDPVYVDAHNNLGTEYQFHNMYDQAIDEYEKVVALNPDYAVAHYNLGNIFTLNGRYDDARIELQTALRLNPNYQKAKNLLQQLHH